MNGPSEFSSQLHREVAPASPASLDQQILKYAHEHAPKKVGVGSTTWLSAVATCSVMGIALLIVLRAPDETLLLDDQLPVRTEMIDAPSPSIKGAVFDQAVVDGIDIDASSIDEIATYEIVSESESKRVRAEGAALNREKASKRQSRRMPEPAGDLLAD